MDTPPEGEHHYHRHHSPPPLPPQEPVAEGRSQTARSLPILLPVFLIFFFLIGFFSVYLLHYLSSTWLSRHFRRNSTGSAGSQPPRDGPGLDPAVIAGFPTFPYDVVRGLREGKCGLECAICLSEFATGDVIRLLTVCCHAFHPVCIDEWLARHKTCPVCRSDLEATPDAATVLAVQRAMGGREGSRESWAITIDVDDAEGQAEAASKRHSRGQSAVIGWRRESVAETEDDDRFTLRLTDAAEEQIAAYHIREGSR